MNRILRISCVLLISLAVSAAGCNKDDKNKGKGKGKKGEVAKKGKDKPPPPAKKITPEESAKRYADCWQSFAKQDKAGIGACYAEKATMVMHDHLPPVEATGRDKIVASLEANFWTMFSEITGEIQLTMVSGNKIAAIVLYKATNTGDMGPMKATGKKIGLLAGAYAEINDQGEAVVSEHWMDQSTIAGQLGLMPKEAPPTPPAMEEGWAEKVVVIAKDDEKEKANLELAKAHLAAFNKHDLKAVMDTYADDVVVFVWGMEPTEGKKASKKTLEGYFAGFSDVKEEPLWTLAAGDYVAASSKSTGTFDGTMPGPPKMKSTGKKFEMNDLTVFKFVDGKIKNQWVFGNGYSWSVQIGIAPSPMELMMKAGGAPPKKEKAPAVKAPAEKAPAKKKAP